MNFNPTPRQPVPGRLRELTTGAKLRVLTGVTVLMLVLLSAASFIVLREVEVNGPLYARIVRSKDLVGDLLPPPLLAVEPQLLAREAADARDPARREALLARLRDAEVAFDERGALWAARLEDGEQRSALAEVRSQGRAVFDLAERELVPALGAGDAPRVEAVLERMAVHAERNRAAVVELVHLTDERVQRAEADGRQRAAFLSRVLVGLVVAIVLGTSLAARAIGRSLVHSERALQGSEARFRAMLEKSTELLSVLDAGACFTFWSPSATALFGWTSEEMMGRCGTDYVHPDDRTRVIEGFRRLRGMPSATERITMRLRHKNGSWRVIDTVRRNLLHDPAVRGVVVNARDVTEHQRLEEEFRQAQKLDSIGRLAGGIAHDFNNLLTVVLSCAEALRADLAKGKPASAADVEAVEEIGAAGARARDLTRQLLAFARRQVIAPVPLDLNVAVRRSESLLRRLLGEDIELVVRLQPDLWPAKCDPGQVEQIIMNLAVNARDAMVGGGTLTIETANRELGAGGGSPGTGGEREQYVRLAVRDSGSGMGDEVKAHLFEPFFTTKPKGRSTGLGLATVYGIVKQNGGLITVESEPGRGSTFEILLPRTLEPPAQGAADPPAVATGGGTETLLVVEDDPQVREVTVRALRAGGYHVLVAGGGREALDLPALKELKLLVTDVVMPGMGGWELAEAMRRRYPGLRVLFVSGYTQTNLAERGVELLSKPFTPTTLLARVRLVLDAPGGAGAPGA